MKREADLLESSRPELEERVGGLEADIERLQANFRRCRGGFLGLLAIQGALLLTLGLVNLPGLTRLVQRDLGLWVGFWTVSFLLPFWACYWEKLLLRALRRTLELTRARLEELQNGELSS